MGSVPGNFAAATITFLAALGAGSWLCRRLTGRSDCFAALITGFVLLAATMLAAAPLLLYIPGTGLAALLLIPALYGARELRDINWRQIDPYAATMLAAGALYMLGSALVLPYAWDEQTYQLSVVRRWLERGSVAPIRDNPYSYFPSLVQLLLVYPVKLGGLGTARLMILGFYLVLYAGLFSELRRMLSKWEALILTMLFAVSPVAAAMAREIYVEPMIALLLLAGLRLRRFAAQGAGRAALSGILAGGAAAVKLTALGAALVIILAGIRKFRWKTLLTALAAATAAGGIFYLRSWIAAGNPVYPFGSAIFAPGNPAAEAVERFHYLMGSFYYGVSGLSGVLTGWLFAAFDEVIFDGIAMGWCWALLIVFGAAGLLLARKKRCNSILLRRYGGALLALYLFWAFTSPQTRFLLPAYVFAVLFGAAAMRVTGPTVRKWALVLLFAAFLINPDVQALLHFKRSWGVAALSRREPLKVLEFATREKDLGAIYDHLAKHTPKHARLLLVFERRTLFAPRRSFNGTPGFQEWIFAPFPKNADELFAQLIERRINYLVIGASPRNPDHLEAYNQLNAELTELLRTLLRQGKLELIPVPDAPNYTLLKVD